MMACLMLLTVLGAVPPAPATAVHAPKRPALAPARPLPSGLSGGAMGHGGAHGAVGGAKAKPSGVNGSDVRRRR
jgi:hypothetical protein